MDGHGSSNHDDDARIQEMTKAAIEMGMAERSFDRLASTNEKIAYEAFVLVALLVKAGQTTQIFEAKDKHSDENVRYALLHVLEIVKETKAEMIGAFT